MNSSGAFPPETVRPELCAPEERQLFELQLRVAQQADRLAPLPKAPRRDDRQLWLEAERQVLGPS
jgi:hypothetical protein